MNKGCTSVKRLIACNVSVVPFFGFSICRSDLVTCTMVCSVKKCHRNDAHSRRMLYGRNTAFCANLNKAIPSYSSTNLIHWLTSYSPETFLTLKSRKQGCTPESNSDDTGKPVRGNTRSAVSKTTERSYNKI